MAQRIIDRSYVGEVLQHLYSSDLDVGITLIAKGGYFYTVDAEKRIPLQGTTIEEAVTHMAYKCAKEFPASNFAGWWKATFGEKFAKG